DLHCAVRFDFDVRRFEVAVDDTFFVRRFESGGELAGDPEYFVERQWAFRRFALDILHHDVVRADIVDLANVRMVQRRNRTRFTLETLGELLFRYLNRDMPVKPLIARQPNRSHAAFANRTEKLIGAEMCAGGWAHGFERF